MGAVCFLGLWDVAGLFSVGLGGGCVRVVFVECVWCVLCVWCFWFVCVVFLFCVCCVNVVCFVGCMRVVCVYVCCVFACVVCGICMWCIWCVWVCECMSADNPALSLIVDLRNRCKTHVLTGEQTVWKFFQDRSEAIYNFYYASEICVVV